MRYVLASAWGRRRRCDERQDGALVGAQLAAAAAFGFEHPSLVQLADELGEPAEAAIALHGLFQLTEDCLDRACWPRCRAPQPSGE